MARALRDRPLYRFILENPSATQQQRDEYMRDAYRQYHSMRRMSHAPVQDSDNDVDALFPVTRASDSPETDIEEQVREFRRQFGDAERVHRQRRRQRFCTDNFERELDWNLKGAFLGRTSNRILGFLVVLLEQRRFGRIGRRRWLRHGSKTRERLGRTAAK